MIEDDLEVPMMMTTMELLMSLIIFYFTDLLRGLRVVVVESRYQSPLTLCCEIFVAENKVINWGVRNRRLKVQVGGGGGGFG